MHGTSVSYDIRVSNSLLYPIRMFSMYRKLCSWYDRRSIRVILTRLLCHVLSHNVQGKCIGYSGKHGGDRNTRKNRIIFDMTNRNVFRRRITLCLAISSAIIFSIGIPQSYLIAIRKRTRITLLHSSLRICETTIVSRRVSIRLKKYHSPSLLNSILPAAHLKNPDSMGK